MESTFKSQQSIKTSIKKASKSGPLSTLLSQLWVHLLISVQIVTEANLKRRKRRWKQFRVDAYPCSSPPQVNKMKGSVALVGPGYT